LQADSSKVRSNQKHVHPKLPELVRRSLRSHYQRPISNHSRESFAKLAEQLAVEPRPLVLDSFCGTGHSTAILAQRHPDHLVVGIDKSSHRLAKHRVTECENYLLLRAQCEDIWRLLLDQKITPDFHYIFYPNPWPKSGHLQRRVHGHPSFRSLLQLGGRLELRSNWLLYIEEFGVAMSIAGVHGTVSRLVPDTPISLFERKYHASEQRLWSYIAGSQALNDEQ